MEKHQLGKFLIVVGLLISINVNVIVLITLPILIIGLLLLWTADVSTLNKVLWSILPGLVFMLLLVAFFVSKIEADPLVEEIKYLREEHYPLPFAEIRKEHEVRLTRELKMNTEVEIPPTQIIKLIEYPTDIGKMSAYLSEIPDDGALHPAIIWIGGGFSNSIGNVWKPQDPSNDQSASVFFRNGIVTMYPSERGGNMNPGSNESGFGEIDDIIAAAEFLGQQDGIDPNRIYLGGHSTGGTKVLLVAAAYHKFKGIFSFGPVTAFISYGDDAVNYEINDADAANLRMPIMWLKDIKSPTWIIEGTNGNIEDLRMFDVVVKGFKLSHIQCIEVENHDHFDVLYSESKFFVEMILAGKI